MNEISESASSATQAARTVGRARGEHAASHPRLACEERAATALQASEAETPEADAAPIQLSLFPAPAQPLQLQAPQFHVRCHECRAINDVPSFPTICFVCQCPLGREHPPF